MAQHWKQFEAWGTASKHNVFLWARLKLTGTYVLILTIILVGFSVILFQNLGRDLNNANDEDFSGQESHQRFVNNTLDTVRNEIIFIDLFIVLVSSGISYVLAGYTLKPIQRSLEAQKKFSENASHELRTPLAVIKNDMEVLLRNPNPTPAATKKTLTSSIEEIDHMSTLTEDLLALARSGNQIAMRERINLSRSAQDIVEKMRPIAERKQVRLTFETNGSAFVRGHAGSLARVFMNLIQNSIQHTSANGEVTVSSNRKPAGIVVEVTDTGTGISEKDLPHIFERFYKGGSQTGSGLGLAIVKEIVENHNGTIAIASTKDVGTTVTMTFPAA